MSRDETELAAIIAALRSNNQISGLFAFPFREGMRFIYTELKEAFNGLTGIPKFAVVLFFKSIAVSLVLTFLSLPATTIYAARYGIRVPIEGTPYIQVTISIWSFMGFAISMVLATIVLFMAVQFKIGIGRFGTIMNELLIGSTLALGAPSLAEAIEFSAAGLETLTNMLRRIIVKSFLYVAIISFCVTVLYYIYVSSGIHALSAEEYRSIYIALIFGALTSLAALAFWHAASGLPIWTLQAYLTPPLIVIMAILLFVYDSYGSMLRLIRFGGGIEISAQLEKIKYGNESTIKGNLILRSIDTAFIMVSGGRIIEVPMREISMLSYDYRPSWKLPDSIFPEQRNYIKIE
jgi:hypothetical protein